MWIYDLICIGSSNGRGPRCAAWFLEHVRATGDEDMQVMTLEGGMKGWVKAGPQFTRLLDGYKPQYWEELFAQEEGQTSTQDSKRLLEGDVTQ